MGGMGGMGMDGMGDVGYEEMMKKYAAGHEGDEL